jgi:hypothetical protein
MRVEVGGIAIDPISDIELTGPPPPIVFSVDFSRDDEPIGRSLKPGWILRFDDVEGRGPVEAKVLSVTEFDGGVTVECERI